MIKYYICVYIYIRLNKFKHNCEVYMRYIYCGDICIKIRWGNRIVLV